MLTLNPVNCWKPLKWEGHSVTGNGERDVLENLPNWAISSQASNPCQSWYDEGSTTNLGSSDPKSGVDMKERFESKVDRTGDCHIWTGHVGQNGYGQISVKNKATYAHRVAWEMENGPIPEGGYILHKCDNRRCVNPEHLFLGDFDENMADMVNKGRQARGERNYHAKLTENQVREIRSLKGTNRSIAERYNVTPSLISMIQSKRIWRHV